MPARFSASSARASRFAAGFRGGAAASDFASPADGVRTKTEYDEAGQVVARIDALRRRTTTTYDALGRVARTTKPDGSTTSTGYDLEGRAVTRSNEAGRTTTTTYDAVGCAVKVTHPDGAFTVTAYDAGQRVSSTDERGFVTTYGYDGAGRMPYKKGKKGKEPDAEKNKEFNLAMVLCTRAEERLIRDALSSFKDETGVISLEIFILS